MYSHKPCFTGCESSWEEAKLVIYGAPFDGTTSFRPGTRFAAQAVRQDSLGFETYSPYQDADLSELAIHDAGDLEVPIGNPAETLELVEAQTRAIRAAGKLPVMLGGEHLLTLGVIRALAQEYPALHIFHFDAHTDLRETFFGQELSHANVIRKCWDILGDGRIHSYGIRSGLKAEFDFGKTHLDYHCFNLNGLAESLAVLKQTAPQTPIYISLDLDVLDPSVMPGTGTPEPGGVSFMELLQALLLFRGFNIVGLDVVELAPNLDHSGISNAACWKLLRELFLIAGKR